MINIVGRAFLFVFAAPSADFVLAYIIHDYITTFIFIFIFIFILS